MAYSGNNRGGNAAYKLQQAYTQADFLKETSKQYGRNTDAYYDAIDAMKVAKVSAAKEFEDFR